MYQHLPKFFTLTFMLFATACGGGELVNCEYSVNGAPVCEDDMTANFCRTERKGDATHVIQKKEDDWEVSCADIGYEVECPYMCIHEDNATHCGVGLYYAESLEMCEKAAPNGEVSLDQELD